MNNKNIPSFLLNKDNLKAFNEQMKQINEVIIKSIRNIFKNEIKETFLLKIFNMIKEKYPNLYNYYSDILNFNFENILQGPNNSMDYDICCHIVGIHKSNMLFLSENEKGEMQKDIKYKEKLCEQVYKNISLRQFGSSFFRKKSLIKDDRFLYFRMGYNMFVTTTIVSSIISDNKLSKNKLLNFYVSFIGEVISILTLLENGLLVQSFPQCRNLIELFFKYEVLYLHPKAIEEYNEFCQYEIDYATTGKFNEKFIEKYNNNCNKEKVDKIDYLHFGWIDSIFEINYYKTEKQYSVRGLYNYLCAREKNNNYLLILKESYNRCHLFSHGSTISKVYPIQAYFELIQIVYPILRTILIHLSKYIGKGIIVNDMDILKKIDNDYKDFSKKLDIMNTKSIEKYYNMNNK